MSRRSNKPAGLPVIHYRAARINMWSTVPCRRVSSELCDDSVQTFQAFIGDTERMAD